MRPRILETNIAGDSASVVAVSVLSRGRGGNR
jgi:hypothetical protein